MKQTAIRFQTCEMKNHYLSIGDNINSGIFSGFLIGTKIQNSEKKRD
jgi:hypothetical protein